MSNWLSSFSLPNPFESDTDDSDAGNGDGPNSKITSSSAGVKQDLSAISQSFSHHLRGVAAFLAPPPQPSSSGTDNQVPGDHASGLVASSGDPEEAIRGIKKDLVEIGSSLKALFSSSSSGISKFASNLLQQQGDGVDDGDSEDDDQEEEEAEIPGSTEDVVEFVRKVSVRPELWTDFPLSLPIGFDLSDVQKQHAAVMEELVPDLLSLRQSFSNMSDGQFWMIYFILLLPRLDETDMELLSSPQIVEVRETLMKKLQNKKEAQVEESSGISETSNAHAANEHINAAQGNVSSSKSVDVSPSEKASSTSDREVEIRKGGESSKNGEDVDDVSFSDLEDEDNDLSDRVSGMKPAQSGRGSSSSDSNEWVRLNENSGAQSSQNKSGLPTRFGKDSEGEESSDWLTVDDSDTDTH